LETAGGIRKALPLLTAGGEEAFLVVNGDIFTDYPFKRLLAEEVNVPYLVLVPNPSHNTAGDFGLFEGMLDPHLGEKYTYSGVSVLPVAMFQELELDKPEALGPILHRAIDSKQVSAELYEGYWADVGTPERLGQVDQWIKEQKIDGF
jgi:MurNAc alpha-1-phosphate uridylyltransferase